MHATCMSPHTQTCANCARFIHAPTYLNTRTICVYCVHILRIYCACYIHAQNIHANIYTTCAYCARYMHAQTHRNIRMLCTIHTCTNLPKHAHIVHVTYMHQPTLTFARCARYIHAHIYPTHTPGA